MRPKYGEKSTCTCGRPIKYSFKTIPPEWVHTDQLDFLVVTEAELEAVLTDPIPYGQNSLHRPTVLHKAKPIKLMES